MQGRELRERRRAAKLTLAQVARAAGTSPSNISAYEHGAKSASEITIQRLSAVLAADSGSVIHDRQLLTVPATAAGLRRGLREGWSTADLLRLIRQSRSDAKHLTTEADRAAYLAPPSTTGAERWDVLLAANAEDLCLKFGWPVPDWTRVKPLRAFWFVSASPRLHPYAFAHSPISMQVRGVMLDPADLEAV